MKDATGLPPQRRMAQICLTILFDWWYHEYSVIGGRVLKNLFCRKRVILKEKDEERWQI